MFRLWKIPTHRTQNYTAHFTCREQNGRNLIFPSIFRVLSHFRASAIGSPLCPWTIQTEERRKKNHPTGLLKLFSYIRSVREPSYPAHIWGRPGVSGSRPVGFGSPRIFFFSLSIHVNRMHVTRCIGRELRAWLYACTNKSLKRTRPNAPADV